MIHSLLMVEAPMHTVVGFDGVWSQTKQGHAAQTERQRVASKLDSSFRTAINARPLLLRDDLAH
jgi:hypothetical protein